MQEKLLSCLLKQPFLRRKRYLNIKLMNCEYRKSWVKQRQEGKYLMLRKHIETPRKMLNFDNGKSAIKSKINTSNQGALKDHQYFRIPADKRSTIDCMHQDNFNKKGGDSWKKEVHGTKDQRVLVDDDKKHDIDTNEILCRLMEQQSAPEVGTG